MLAMILSRMSCSEKPPPLPVYSMDTVPNVSLDKTLIPFCPVMLDGFSRLSIVIEDPDVLPVIGATKFNWLSFESRAVCSPLIIEIECDVGWLYSVSLNRAFAGTSVSTLELDTLPASWAVR